MTENLRQSTRDLFRSSGSHQCHLLDPDMQVIDDFLEVVARYGHARGNQPEGGRGQALTHLACRSPKVVPPEYLRDLDLAGRTAG